MKFDEENMEVTLAASKKPARPDGRSGGESRQVAEGHLTIDVFQTEDEVIIQSTIAGVDTNDLDISVTNDMVTIKGKRQPEDKIKPSDYYWQELYWGPFSRSIILPVDVDADAAKASMKNGLLTIRLPKMDRVRTKKIRIS
ncbi:MAG: Hsp20/alpha crystallin family protein [Candidatus Yanofskybacteria bacterium]|nr:Hsp20/alpha crystallin family protein [Candidatus Yanofskybacteria bacterium]